MATTRKPAKQAPTRKPAAKKRVAKQAAPPLPSSRHAVRASLRNVDLTKATTALTLVLRDEGEKMGELVVGRGSFFWKARNGKKRKRITWADFAALMDRHPG
ncbi:hypothetical protein LVB87_04575 [Lysobacter sp. KIS68-7]|uniref:hypothetical protein n=1 Tax=Lysobacter sp. KIS68-7 TaxID=2904252 RepID=UPI001E48E09F|nr:hypothetical protein [Lysobacter sp. KIS68-7]UHQ20440.1 hypothetical protein LVB87_04575 [Lysobacter sp. KIS68-7]